MIVIEILGLSFLVTHYKDFINEVKIVISNPKEVFNIPIKIISCYMCASYWIGLILTSGNIALSGFCGLCAYLLDKHLINTDIKL